MRVSDDDVRHWLTWARNYEEIESFANVAERGRKWKITLAEPATADGAPLGGFMGHRPETVVPEEVVLTSREALAFCMGCAAARRVESFTRKHEEWGW